jgi:uncharacterized membrane protein YhhN
VPSPSIPVVLFLASTAAAVYAAESGRRVLIAVTKPLTTLLLFLVLGRPTTPFAWLVAGGVLFSLIGDVALLGSSKKAFMAGLVSFLVAHAAYAAGFVSVGTWSLRVAAAGLVVAAAAVVLVRALWAGAVGLRVPVVIYAAAISTMVVSATATLGGALPAPAPALAVAGAVLFFISDASLSLDKFHRPIPHAALLTLGVYWLGQLGIVLAARGGLP